MTTLVGKISIMSTRHQSSTTRKGKKLCAYAAEGKLGLMGDTKEELLVCGVGPSMLLGSTVKRRRMAESNISRGPYMLVL
jgi:hypothetical protein